MLSCVIDDKYVIIPDESYKYPIIVNKDDLDKKLNAIIDYLTHISELFKDLYETDYNTYLILTESIGYLDFDDGRCWKLDNTLYELQDLHKNLLTNNDFEDKISIDDFETLEHLGFVREYYSDNNCWINRVQDDDDVEIVRELIIYPNKEPIYRLRTIYWETTSGCKSSKSIKYENLPLSLDKKLTIAIKNKLAETSA